MLSLPKIPSAYGLGNVRGNWRILYRDACPVSPALCANLRPVQVAAPVEIENLYLRHQLSIAMRKAPHGLRLRGANRAFMVWMTRLWPDLLSLSRVVQPDTIVKGRGFVRAGGFVPSPARGAGGDGCGLLRKADRGARSQFWSIRVSRKRATRSSRKRATRETLPKPRCPTWCAGDRCPRPRDRARIRAVRDCRNTRCRGRSIRAAA